MTVAYFNGPQDWLIIGLLVLVLFGGAKIPQLAKGLGEAIREFKESVAPRSRFDDFNDRSGLDTDKSDAEKRDAFIVAVLVVTISILVVLLFTV